MRVAEDGWYRLTLPVRFRDLDAMGHAHHTLPLIYLEEARAAFWRELKGADTPGASDAIDTIDYVMAGITLRFHARIRYPASVSVLLAVSDVGTKSFTTAFEIRGDDDTLLASGSAVQVAYDYAASRTKPLAAEDRRLLMAWQQRR
jgi:acyl-CoA thioester hydrolase